MVGTRRVSESVLVDAVGLVGLARVAAPGLAARLLEAVGAEAGVLVVVLPADHPTAPVTAVLDGPSLADRTEALDAHGRTYGRQADKSRRLNGVPARRGGVQQARIVVGLAVIFGGMTALLLLLSVVLVEPVLLVVAFPVGCAAVVFWYQASGSFAARVRRRQPSATTGRGGSGAGQRDRGASGSRRRRDGPEERGGFGAGPREGFQSERGRRARERWERRRERGRRAGGGDGPGATELSRAEAYRRLGLEDGADQREVKRAYHEKVKEVHPDRGGDEEAFKDVTEAYERLSE